MSVFTLITLFATLTTLILVQTSSLVSSFSSGAPTRACLTQSPFHLFASASPPASSPFEVRAFTKPDMKTGRTMVHVSIVPKATPGQQFRGFILGARLASMPDVIVDGDFMPEDDTSQAFTCGPNNHHLVSFF